jgi:predicted O-methyltransferase YrrM
MDSAIEQTVAIDQAIQSVLNEFHARATAESERIRQIPFEELQTRWDEFLLPVGPAFGQVMNVLIKEAGFRTILEVGSSYGYSTVWLAEAARHTGGKVISLEIHPGKQEHARESVTKAGLAGFVDFRLGDARESIRAMKERVDFVLLDLWKVFYIDCFDLVYTKLNPGALIAADNMIFPEFSREAAVKYQQHVRAKPDIQSVLLQVGSGMELSRYTRGAEFV